MPSRPVKGDASAEPTLGSASQSVDRELLSARARYYASLPRGEFAGYDSEEAFDAALRDTEYYAQIEATRKALAAARQPRKSAS